MKRKILKVSLVILAIIGIVYGISNFVTKEVKVAKAVSSNYQAQTGVLAPGEIDPNSYSYNVNIDRFYSLYGEWTKDGNMMPVHGNFQIYCREPGTYLFNKPYSYSQGTSDGWYSKEELQQLIDSTGTYHYSDHCHASTPYEGLNTPQYTYPVSSALKLPAAYAYIVSTSKSYSLTKQSAMWALRKTPYDEGLIGDGTPHAGGASTGGLDEEGKAYADYDKVIRQYGFSASNSTNMSNVTTKVDQSAKEYIVGPFNVTYTDMRYGGIAFSGMSSMTVIGYDANGNVVNNNIPIKAFIVNGSRITPRFFTPSSTEKVDRGAQSYPGSGQDFQVVFDDPNGGLAENQKIKYVSLNVQFKYMLADGRYEALASTKYTINYLHYHYEHHQDWYHSKPHQKVTIPEHWEGSQYIPEHDAYVCPDSDCWTYRWDDKCRTNGYISGDHRQGLFVADGIRTLYQIEFKIDTKVDISMDLAGYVWDDRVSGKESLSDGSMATSDNIDRRLPNVRVLLYSGEELLNETRTDSEGHYTFDDLDAMKKYTVTFEYNGQIYMPTQKEADGVSYQNSSKGLEKQSERDAFDNKFGEIGSSPKNYPQGQAFTRLELMGYELGEDGIYRKTNPRAMDGYDFNQYGGEKDEYVLAESGSGADWNEKIKFVNECQIRSYTEEYPKQNQFVIHDSDVDAGGAHFQAIYDELYYINQGLWRRQETDAALKKDLYRAVLKINNKTEVYKYDERKQTTDYWDIHVRMSDYDSYYNSEYINKLYSSDYLYNSKELNHPGNDLDILVTYKISVTNQSQSIMQQIREVVDYYDKDYTYIDNLSWVTYVGEGKTNTVTDSEYYNAMVAENLSSITNARPVSASTTSRYGAETHSDLSGTFNTIYIRGLEGKKLATGAQAYIYLTFRVNKSNNKVLLDTDNSAKQNLAEINGYITYYKDDTRLPNNVTKNSNDRAGLIDVDSVPGNLSRSDLQGNKYEKRFEDDTDRAKGFRLILDENAKRKANGTVWEDKRTVKENDSMIGNGIRENNETKVAGITVQLVEKTIDGKEYVWQETTTNANGVYNFEDYIPGDYVIRFYYGNQASNTKVKDNDSYTAGGQNVVSYNGQDFKSTTYQKDLKQSEYTDTSNRYKGYTNVTTQNETGTYGYDIYTADSTSQNLSDAKDLWSVSNVVAKTYKPNTTITETKEIQGRSKVITYSNNNVTNHVAEVLASPYETPTYNGTAYTKQQMDELINELIQNTYMTAETGVITVEVEYDRQQTVTGANSGIVKNDYNNQVNGNYTLANIDLGLVERPKAALEIDKSIDNIKVTLANGNILFDVKGSRDNVIWKDHTPYNVESKKSNGIYENYYGNSSKNRYSYKAEIDNILKNSDKGIVQLTMDEELMHGATIEITYKIKVSNVGEVDYEGENYYYLGNSSGANQVTTTPNQVIDYVANNLKFDSSNTANSGWSVLTPDSVLSDKLVNEKLSESVKKFDNIAQTEDYGKTLKVGENVEKTFVLTQLITTENTSDDLTYGNVTEIVKTSNTVGRRMAFSVVGNQNPTDSAASEIDSSLAERVIILPPFGDAKIYYAIIFSVAALLIVGIALIIKKVLKK